MLILNISAELSDLRQNNLTVSLLYMMFDENYGSLN